MFISIIGSRWTRDTLPLHNLSGKRRQSPFHPFKFYFFVRNHVCNNDRIINKMNIKTYQLKVLKRYPFTVLYRKVICLTYAFGNCQYFDFQLAHLWTKRSCQAFFKIIKIFYIFWGAKTITAIFKKRTTNLSWFAILSN